MSRFGRHVALFTALFGVPALAIGQSSQPHPVPFKLVFSPGSVALPANAAAAMAPFCNLARPLDLSFITAYNPASDAVMLQREQAVVTALNACGATLQTVGYGTAGGQPAANGDTLTVIVLSK